MATSSSTLPENGPVEEDEMMFGAESGWVEPLTSCDHLATSLSSDLAHIPTPDTPCNSRFVNKHMLQHFRETNHSVALSYSDLSVWCFTCDAYLNAEVILQLRPVYETAYILKFGEAPPFHIGEHPKVEDQ
ncbi:Histone deacetylase-like protein [Citrus sinensis]|nr:Histone deacetylase-like protein [Citrus sinensis]